MIAPRSRDGLRHQVDLPLLRSNAFCLLASAAPAVNIESETGRATEVETAGLAFKL
jgi:hypothetical protein